MNREITQARKLPIMTNDKHPQGSFIRWQSITIAQLTYSLNLILGFSVAAMGFEVSLLIDNKICLSECQKCTLFSSIISLVFSVGFGIWCVINRLLSFRATAKSARLREEKRSDDEIQPYRDEYMKFDSRTWGLFWWQIGTFSSGILAGALTALLSCSSIDWPTRIELF